MKKLFINVDIDTLKFYYKIFGVNNYLEDNVIWEKGVPRFLKFFKKLNVKANFFVVGSDFKNIKNIKIAKKIISEGHRINSHTYYHDYGLTKRNYNQVHLDIKKNQKILNKLFGIKNIIFRAPGYKMNGKIYQSLKNNGVQYSSSVMPSTLYSFIKNLTILKNLIFFKKSKSLIDYSFNLFQKKNAYIHKQTKIIEIPISTIPVFQIPFTGTFLSLGDEFLFNLSKNIIIKKKNINLEFHGIDLIDFEDLKKHPFINKNQIDLKKTKNYKEKIFQKWISLILKTHKNSFLEDIYK
jgi:hypothetical protein